MKKTLITIELFLAFLVIVLFGFLLVIFSNSKKENEVQLPTASVDTKELYCGISITSPQIGSFVSLPVQVEGYVSGCGWEPYSNYVARMKIYNDNKELIGRPYLVNKSPGSSSPVSSQFEFKIEGLPIKEGAVTFVFENFGSQEKKMTLPLNIIQPSVDESLE